MLSDGVSKLQVGGSETKLNISTIESSLFSMMAGVYAVKHLCKLFRELCVKINPVKYGTCAVILG